MRSILLSIILALSVYSQQLEIPGCPDINSLSESANELEGDKLDQIKCVCSSDQIGIEVNCVFGASLENLSNVLNTITKLNKTVKQINLNHVTVTTNSTSLIDLLAYGSSSEIEGLEIKNCHGGPLEISEPATNESIIFNKLRLMAIENCELTQLPSALISRTNQLESISLNNNKIESVSVDDLKSVSNSLEFMDLSENLIGDIEEGAFSQLNKLRTLLIGEHNFANLSVINEITEIKKLEILDLTRIDGINSVDQLEFSENNLIERLVLTGCNIKSINTSSFSSFAQLKELDMRVNLIEHLESGSFIGLTNLERISLAGNFLRDTQIRADRWEDLGNLTQLDLGWNELKILRANSFGPNIGNIRVLSLRSNEKLTEIEDGAFTGLSQLQNLNISGSALMRLGGGLFNGLEKLKFLDLSNNNLSDIDKNAFNSMKDSLSVLNLANNNLKTLDVEVISRLFNLTELDISGNAWLCDKHIFKVADWIRSQYLNAAKTSRTFLLSNAGKTLCDRPYSLRDKSILDLNANDIKEEYSESMDTTTIASLQENATQTSIPESTSLIDFSKLILNVGEKNDTLEVNIDEGKPVYDINLIKYGQRPITESGNSWISGVIVIALLIITAIGVLVVIRNKAKKNEEESVAPEQALSSV